MGRAEETGPEANRKASDASGRERRERTPNRREDATPRAEAGRATKRTSSCPEDAPPRGEAGRATKRTPSCPEDATPWAEAGRARRQARPGSWRLAALAAGLLAAGCQQRADTPAEAPGTAPVKPPSFVYVSPDPLGVNPFLLLGQKGLEAAGARHGAKTKVLESDDPTSRAENLRWAAHNGATLVILLGFEFADVLTQVAPEAPGVQFLIVDQCIAAPPPNVHCAVFREHEAAFLLGAVAAWLSPGRHVGVIAALDIPFLHRHTEGFTAGARHVDPEIQVSIRWVGGENPFSDPVRSKEQALALAAAGASPILAAAGGGNFGIFEAAKEKDFLTFGVDVNQCPAAPGHVVDNLVKRVDRAIVESVDAILAGTAPAVQVYGLADGGLSLISLDPEPSGDSQCVLPQHPEVLDAARKLRQEIVDGKLRIPDPMAAR